MNGQANQNGFNHERAGQKRVRDVDEMDSECLPISKRINSLSLNTAGQMGSNGWPVAGPSSALPSPVANPPLHMPVLVDGPAASGVTTAPGPAPTSAPVAASVPALATAPLPSEPDLSPEECPEYFTINCYLYQLHMERLRRQQGGQF